MKRHLLQLAVRLPPANMAATLRHPAMVSRVANPDILVTVHLVVSPEATVNLAMARDMLEVPRSLAMDSLMVVAAMEANRRPLHPTMQHMVGLQEEVKGVILHSILSTHQAHRVIRDFSV